MVRYEASYYTVVNGRVQFPVAEHLPLEGPLSILGDKGRTRDPRVWNGKQPFRENNSPRVSSAPPCYISLRPAIQTFQRGDYSPECHCLFLTYVALERRRGRRQERLLLVAIFLFSGASETSWHSKFLPARTGGLLVQPSVFRALRQLSRDIPLQRVHSHFNRGNTPVEVPCATVSALGIFRVHKHLAAFSASITRMRSPR